MYSYTCVLYDIRRVTDNFFCNVKLSIWKYTCNSIHDNHVQLQIGWTGFLNMAATFLSAHGTHFWQNVWQIISCCMYIYIPDEAHYDVQKLGENSQTIANYDKTTCACYLTWLRAKTTFIHVRKFWFPWFRSISLLRCAYFVPICASFPGSDKFCLLTIVNNWLALHVIVYITLLDAIDLMSHTATMSLD